MPERDQLEQAIIAMEQQRAALGDAVVDAAVAAFRARLDQIKEAPTSEQRKIATILFAEIAGMEDQAKGMDAEESHDLLSNIWENLDALVIDHGGMIDKHIDHAVMALFGIPNAHENDPERAAWAALDLQQAIKFHQKSATLRIGIHTGMLMIATSEATGELNTLGDAVNLASRLQKAAKPGEILVSQDTHPHLRGIFDLQTLDPLAVRGKTEPVQIYRLRSGRTRSMHLRTAAPGLSGESIPLVGRAAELQSMLAVYRNSVKNRLISIVTIHGETGIGKTRLAQEFCALTPRETRTNPLILQTYSTLEDVRIPFALLRRLLVNHYKLDVSAPPEVIRSRLETEFRALLRLDGLEAAHLVGHLAGFDFSDSPFIQRYRENANALHQRAMQLCPRFFQSLASTRPLIIILDDLQWADPDSLKLIDALVNEKINFPSMLICLSRLAFQEGIAARSGISPVDSARVLRSDWPNHTHLQLSALNTDEVDRLSAALLHLPPDQAVPPELSNALGQRANGNPFFISEMLRMWFEDSTIQFIEGQWRINNRSLERQKVPSTLTEVMQARLDSLPIPERDLLKRAAIIGRIFWSQSLEALAPHTSEDTAELLQQLDQRGLIVARGKTSIPGCREYQFTHSLLYQVTYENVLQRTRPGYHARAAGWLEQQSERLNTNLYAAQVAEHYEKAGQTNLAAQWYERGGDYAFSRYQPEIALENFQKSLQFAKNIEYIQQLQLLRKIGDGLWWMARYAQGLELANMQAEIAQAHDQPASWSDALNRMSAIQNRLGDHILGLKYSNQSADIARRANAIPELAAALFYRGVSLYRLGNYSEALSAIKEAEALSPQLEIERGAHYAHTELIRGANLLGMIHQSRADYQAARDEFERVLEYHRTNNNQSGAIAALNNLGVNAHIRGDFPTAIQFYRQALDEARLVGYRDIEWVCLSNLSGAQAETGLYKEAEAGLRQVLENAQASGWFMLAETKRFMAIALLGQRRRQEALEYARESLELARKSGGQEYLGRAWRVLGMIAVQSPSRTVFLPEEISASSQTALAPQKEFRASQCFALSQESFLKIGNGGDLARTRREWARFELHHGDPVIGQELWSQAYASFETLGMQDELKRMQVENLTSSDHSERGIP